MVKSNRQSFQDGKYGIEISLLILLIIILYGSDILIFSG
jgi:hypothetical protein